jgi:hypothetical protein
MTNEERKYWNLCKDRKPEDKGHSLHVMHQTHHIEDKIVTLFWVIDDSDNPEPDMVEIKDRVK